MKDLGVTLAHVAGPPFGAVAPPLIQVPAFCGRRIRAILRARRIRKIQESNRREWVFPGEAYLERIHLLVDSVRWSYEPRVGTIRVFVVDVAWRISAGQRKSVGEWYGSVGCASMPRGMPRTVIMFRKVFEAMATEQIRPLRKGLAHDCLKSENQYFGERAQFDRVWKAAAAAIRRHEIGGASFRISASDHFEAIVNHEIDHKAREILFRLPGGEPLADLYSMSLEKGAFFILSNFFCSLRVERKVYEIMGPWAANSARRTWRRMPRAGPTGSYRRASSRGRARNSKRSRGGRILCFC
ncbi:MAG TPA: hypothetical protein PLU30_26600 [Verrucomicrobiae bacterium]|nr:hypothetical protein [Verrucomicrobiae bacterium]